VAQLLDPLKDLGVFILPIPTPFSVGHINLTAEPFLKA